MADLIACAGSASDPLGARWVPPLPEGDGEELAAFYERCRLEGALLAQVIADVMKYVPKERIVCGTNCGMAPMHRAIAEAKLGALGAGARLARQRLG